MSPNEINAAIAEIVGWTILQVEVDGLADVIFLPPGVSDTDENRMLHAVTSAPPNYYGDLNAIHQAVMSLPPIKRHAMINHAFNIWPAALEDCLERMHNADAPTRCKLLLLAHGKWRDA